MERSRPESTCKLRSRVRLLQSPRCWELSDGPMVATPNVRQTRGGTRRDRDRNPRASSEAGSVFCNYFSDGNVVMVQWWLLQTCAKRDGAWRDRGWYPWTVGLSPLRHSMQRSLTIHRAILSKYLPKTPLLSTIPEICNTVGSENSVNMQWRPLQMCLKRDDACQERDGANLRIHLYDWPSGIAETLGQIPFQSMSASRFKYSNMEGDESDLRYSVHSLQSVASFPCQYANVPSFAKAGKSRVSE